MNRQHHYDAAGQLTRIDTPRGPHEYGYDKAGRLIAASQPGLTNQQYRFDPAGNRLFENTTTATPQSHWEETVRQHARDKHFNLLGKGSAQDTHHTANKWMDNRITDDGEYHYEYDRWGNTTRKHKAEGNEEHRYHYDRNHRLIHFTFESDNATRGANYHYDVFGRRLLKQVQHGDKDGALVGDIETTWFGWDGDRLVLTEKNDHQIHTIYESGSFVPMIRVEGEKAKTRQTLAQKLQAQTGIALDRATEAMFDVVEDELQCNQLSELTKEWMAASGVQPQTLKDMLEPAVPMQGKQVHLYQCDHLGTPLALMNDAGKQEWGIELGAWGKVLKEHNDNGLSQPIRFQGQQWDKESGLYYNRHRYFDTQIGRYIALDPIGLEGDVNSYSYAAGDPLHFSDPLGLKLKADSKHCKDLRQKIKNLQEDLDDRWDDLARDPLGLPERIGPGEKLSQTKRGHRTMINDRANSLQKYEERYAEECEDDDGNNLTCETGCAATGVVATVGLGYVLYRAVRMIPSLFPALWPTLPLNLSTP